MATGRSADLRDGLVFREVDRAVWPDLVRLFEEPGGPKHCWCMAWRATAAETRRIGKRGRKEALERRVRAGVPVGILGYSEGEPVAWCSVAPRVTYRAMGGLHVPEEAPGSVWSIACFFVVRKLRGAGVAQRLISAAVQVARRHGAAIVEAYPVEPTSPSYRFMGFVQTFTAAGFREVGRAGIRRHVMRLELAPTSQTVS